MNPEEDRGRAIRIHLFPGALAGSLGPTEREGTESALSPPPRNITPSGAARSPSGQPLLQELRGTGLLEGGDACFRPTLCTQQPGDLGQVISVLWASISSSGAFWISSLAGTAFYPHSHERLGQSQHRSPKWTHTDPQGGFRGPGSFPRPHQGLPLT